MIVPTGQSCARMTARSSTEVPPDGCANGRSSPDGTCFGCPDLRRLDDSAWDNRLETLTESARAAELHTRLWCPEHGHMRASQTTVTKICRLPGSTFHDGGLNRLW